MNPRVEKLLKQPTARKITLLGVVLILIVLAFVSLLALPAYQQWDALQAESRQLDSEIAQKRVLAANLDEYKAEYARLEEELRLALTKLPNQSEIPSLLTSLAGLAKENGLEVQSFKPLAEVPKGFYAEVPAEMSLRGNYHEVALFAAAVSALPRIVNISNLSLSKPVMVDNEAVLTIACSVLTFRFIESKQEPRS